MERFLRRVINTMKGFGHGSYREKVLGLFSLLRTRLNIEKMGMGNILRIKEHLFSMSKKNQKGTGLKLQDKNLD